MASIKDRFTATLTELRPREIKGRRPGRIALRLSTSAGRQDVTIDGPCITIGSHDESTIVVKDDAVSKVHCELRLVDDGALLRDLGSKNGTWISNIRVYEVGLPAGASFSVGGCTITVGSVDAIDVPISTSGRFGQLHGRGSKMGELFSKLERLAALPLDVLVIGETGTGKELIARGIHEESARRDGPFVVVDCTNLNDGIAESTLFGHRKGAFTGAIADQPGLLEQAHGGTLFFDEIGELPSNLQPKLLRALEQRETRRIGEMQYRSFDARIVAATNRDLLRMVGEGRFRDDLYFRLSQITLSTPPLRERGRGDITLLADLFLARFAKECGRSLRFDKSAYAALTASTWPGNVRQLRNVIRNVALLAEGDEIGDDDLPPLDIADLATPPPPEVDVLITDALTVPWGEARRVFEKVYVAHALRVSGGNQSEAARMTGMSRSALRALLKRTED